MGITAENLVDRYGISREGQDAFAALSQRRAEEAMSEGRFAAEIVPVSIPQRKGEPKRVDTDEHPRPGTTAEALGKLKPAFKKEGTVTAGNASGLNDGAAALVVAGPARARTLGRAPLARILSYASAAVDPKVMGIGPVPAVRKALEKAGLGADDIDLWELNEPFAAQSLAVLRELELDARQGQRQRRRHRPWPPDRSIRGADPGDDAARDGRPRRAAGARRAVHRGRAGCRDGGRAGLRAPTSAVNRRRATGVS